jgi:ligand-binding SRPBCC domain-containing protein
MRTFRHTIWINRRPEEVWDFFTDFTQASRWRSYVASMVVQGGGPVKAGSRVDVSMDLLGERHDFVLEVLTCNRPSLWRHRSMEHDYTGYIEYRFDAEHDGTRVTMEGHAKPISLYGWLGLPQLFLARKKSYREQLPQLKRAMEGV